MFFDTGDELTPFHTAVERYFAAKDRN